MAKENDLFLNQLENILFNAFDFSKVGLNAANTSLESKETYKNLDYVRNHPYFQTNGAFDETKFNNFYAYTINTYNQMANNELGDLIGAHASFYRNDIYAPEDKKRKGYEIEMFRAPNPMKQFKGFGSSVDSIIENPLSLREIALTQKVWDYRNEKWIDAPNDAGLFTNFGRTLVLAQYDEDGTHKDPITGQIVQHKKGDKKLNSEGTYYYETLGGRSVYGREVLSKWDTITTDGSFMNKFDPFDADDKDPNFLGVLIRNTFKIVPAFLSSTIAPYYLGLRVALNMTDLMATGGNMLTDNNNTVFNGIEGYIKSLGFSTSEYSQDRPWALENILNMGADVFTLLAEQRWLFKYPPALFKGKHGISEENLEKLRLGYLNQSRTRTTEELAKLSKEGYIDVRALGDMAAINHIYAQQLVAKYIDDYQKIGRILSMSYMTGITVKDSYGEAKQEGATGIEAALLTLGYAFAEYKLINSDLGRWILPELRALNNRWRLIGRELQKQGLREKLNLYILDKKKVADWAKRVIHIGKTRALEDYNTINKLNVMTLTAKAMFANALGEGVEETAEELLYDASKSMYNLLHVLSGRSDRLTAFDNMFDRYALSFVGGVIGGGLGEATTEYRQAASLKAIDKEKAFDELVQIVKEGKGDEFKKVVGKTVWASTRLSMDPADIEYDENGLPKQTGENTLYKPADDTHLSLNEVVKNSLFSLVDFIDNTLSIEGAKISDNSLISRISSIDDPLREFRALTLSHSVLARDFTTNFNTLVYSLVKNKLTLDKHYKVAIESSDSKLKKLNENPNFLEEETELKNKIAEQEKELLEYFDPKSDKIKDLTKKVLFEMSSPILEALKESKLTLASFLETTYRKPIDKINEEELKQGIEKFKSLYSTDGKQSLISFYDLFNIIITKATPIAEWFTLTYFDPNSFIGKFADFVHREEVIALKAESELAIKNYEQRYADKFGQIKTFLLALSKTGKTTATFDLIVDLFNNVDTENDDGSTYLKLQDIIIKSFTSDIRKGKTLLKEIKLSPYITAAVKKDLKNVLGAINTQFNLIDDPDSEELYVNEKVNNYILEIIKAVDETPYAPITEFLDSFSVAAKNKKETVKISKLIEELDDYFYNSGKKGLLRDLSYSSSDTEEQIKNAINVIDLAIATVQAMRVDNAAMGDLFGFTKSVNEIDPDAKLAEIDANTADTMTQQLSQIRDRLSYYRTLIDINAGNRLNLNSKTSVKGHVLFFDKIITRFNLPDFPPGSESAADELKSLLNNEENFKLLRKLLKNLQDGTNDWNLSDDLKLAFREEIKILLDALHTFFKNNQELIDDPEKLSEFLNPEITGIYNLDEDILNISSSQISDSAFIWYLAALASMDPSKYYSLYQTSLKDGDLIPVIGLETVLMIDYAFILNTKVFQNFGKAWNIALEKYASDSDHEQKLKELKYTAEFLGNDSEVSIDFLQTILTEGIAGSGKSNGVAKALIKLIKLNPSASHLLENVWFVHTSEKKAQALAEKLGLENVKVFSHNSLMKKISGTNPETGRTWNEVIDNNGNLIIDPLDLIYEERKPLHYNFPLNSTEKPTLIITDEVSHLSIPSLYLIDQFVEQSGTVHLTFGDFHQSGVTHVLKNIDVKTPDGSTKHIVTYKGEAYNTNFPHGPKLGESLRTDNKLKDYNNTLTETMMMSEWMKIIPSSGRIHKISLKYKDDPEYGLLGDKVLFTPNEGELEKWFKDFENYVRGLLDKTVELGLGEKIGYIYDTNSIEDGATFNKSISEKITEIMRNLSKEDKYKDRIDFREGDQAQGDEHPYYITNIGAVAPTNGEHKSYLKDIYTGITRALRGNIIINYPGGTQIFFEQSTLDDTGKDIPITESVKSKYIGDTLLVYEKVYGEFEKDSLPYIPYSKQKGTKNPKIPVGDKSIPIGTVFTDGNANYKLTKYVDSYAILENIEDASDVKKVPINDLSLWTRITDTNSEEIEKLNSVNLNKDKLIDNSKSDLLMMHHSFNALETSIIETIDSNGRKQYHFAPWADVRLDNAIGLAKLLNIDVNKKLTETLAKRLKHVLNVIRAAARTEKSEEDILKYIEKSIKTLNKDFSIEGMSIEFFYKVSLRSELFEDNPNPGVTTPTPEILDGKYRKGKYYKSKQEVVERFVSDEKSSQKPNDATISLMLKDANGKEILELPILTDTNPVTLAFSNGFNEIAEWMEKKRDELIENNSLEFITLLKALKNELTNGNLKGHPLAAKLLNLISIFEATLTKLPMGGNILILTNAKGEKLILGRDWENTGIILRTSESNTIANSDEFVEYTGNPVSYYTLEEADQCKLSDSVYIAPRDITVILDGRTVTVKAGHPFIIVSDSIHKYDKGVDDDVLWDEFRKNSNDISIIYIEPTSKSFTEYLKHLDSVYSSNQETYAPQLGQTTTSFRIIQELFNNNEDFVREKLKLFSPDNHEEIFNELKELVDSLSEIEVTKSGKENELVIALTKLVKDSLSNSDKLLNNSKAKTKYVNVFDKLVRLFSLGEYEDFKLQYAKPDSDLKSVKEVEQLIGEKFKYGFFERTTYLEKGEGDSIGEGEFRIIKANISKELIRIRGTLVTSALITKNFGEGRNESETYEKFRKQARTNGHQSLADSKIYETTETFNKKSKKGSTKKNYLAEFNGIVSPYLINNNIIDINKEIEHQLESNKDIKSIDINGKKLYYSLKEVEAEAKLQNKDLTDDSIEPVISYNAETGKVEITFRTIIKGGSGEDIFIDLSLLNKLNDITINSGNSVMLNLSLIILGKDSGIEEMISNHTLKSYLIEEFDKNLMFKLKMNFKLNLLSMLIEDADVKNFITNLMETIKTWC